MLRNVRHKLPLSALGLVLATTFLMPSSALADSPSIAGAPAVPFGQQSFGNTASVSADNEACHNSYWLLPVTAGDKITLDWESQARYARLYVFPVGISDFNVSYDSRYQTGYLGPNSKGEAIFSAPASGVMPVSFRGCDDDSDFVGPYAFTAYVLHAIRLSVPSFSKLRRKATLQVSVRNAEGGVVSDPSLLVDVQVRPGRKWLTVGTAPVVNSVAAVKLNVPARFAGRKVSLRAVAHGGPYRRAASQSKRHRVAGKVKRG